MVYELTNGLRDEMGNHPKIDSVSGAEFPRLERWLFFFFFLNADWILRSEKWKHSRESFCACIWRFPIVIFTHDNLVVLITGPRREEMRQILLRSDFKTWLCGGHGLAQRKTTVILVLRRVTQIFRQLHHFVVLHRLHLACVCYVKKVHKLAGFYQTGLPWALILFLEL